MFKTFIFFILACIFSTANAVDNLRYTCQHGDATRIIEIAYLQGKAVPCEVSYQKENGDFQILWRAENSEGYCETRADAFLQKQASWGWLCEIDTGNAVLPSPSPSPSN